MEKLLAHREAKKEAKVIADKVKASKYEKLYSRLDTKRKNDIYRFGKARERKTIGFTNVRFIKWVNSKLLINGRDIKKRRKEYFKALLNEEFLGENQSKLNEKKDQMR